MHSRLLRRAALTVAALVALAGPVAASAASTPAAPIPSDPRDPAVQSFTGKAATAQPYAAQSVPRNPYMAPNERSNIHNDAYQTDAYNTAGPLGRDLEVSSTLFAAECASVTFDRHGRIVTVCVSPTGATLRLIDPDSLATLASYELPMRAPGTFSFNNFSGGGYFYLDNQDRAVVATFTGHLLTLALKADESGFDVVRDVDLSAATGGSGIQSALPDWAGRIWFVTQSGVVGFVTSANVVHTVHLPAGETIANSFAMDESGGVFVVSTHALYRYDVRSGKPSVTWRKTYDRGTRVKDGQVSQGSGTTPTLIGSASSAGGGSVAITDNADPQMNVLVFRRGKAGPGPALCKQPVFPAGQGSDENSLISVPGGLVAENNYGYVGPKPDAPSTRTADTTPGLVKVAVDYAKGGCHVEWRNTTARVPTVVSKLSRGSGLIYGYTHPSASEIPFVGATSPRLPLRMRGSSPRSAPAPASRSGRSTPAPASATTTTTPRSASVPTARRTSGRWVGCCGSPTRAGSRCRFHDSGSETGTDVRKLSDRPASSCTSSGRRACRWRPAGWLGASVQPGDAGVVRGGLRAADRCAERCLGRDRGWSARPGGGADRLGQDAVGVPVVHRPSGDRARAGEEETLPSALRLAAQGTRGRRRAQPPRAPGRHPADGRAARRRGSRDPSGRAIG